jgi:hypothetical protein
MTFRINTRTASLAVMTALPVAAAGAEPAAAKVLDAVSVTATREARATADVPQAIAVVGKEALEQKKMFNVKEALQEIPGVLIDSKNGGFVGTAVLIILYLLIVIWGIYIARRASDRFGMYLAVGVTAMLFWHIIVNLGMVTGLLPVVGVPLPLFSYGGTSMVTSMIGVGLLLNVSMRRFMF